MHKLTTAIYCYWCGGEIGTYFCLLIVDATTKPPKEVVVCGKCGDEHPEYEYARGE